MNSYAHHGLLPTNIPLHCNICPKKPDFSDVSHLLTHIASKGHLSHYYKMKVKASTDHDSQQVVAEYDEWYEEWNVQELMRERLSQKEKKNGGANGNGTTSRRASAANSLASNTARNTPIPAPRAPRPRRPYTFRENTLDPQLDRIIKQEPMSRSTTPIGPFAMDPAQVSRQWEPMMQMSPFVDSPMTYETSAFNSLYNTPSSDSYEQEMPPPTKKTTRKKGRRTVSGSNQSVEADAEEADYDTTNDKLVLKGVVWPGMDLFDSATLENKRKRNQKKDASVLDALMATSQEIQPTEAVFDSDQVLRRERYITGNPNEEDGMSPLPGEESPEPSSPPSTKPKKKKNAPRKARGPRQGRAALSTMDTNTSRTTRRSRGQSHHPPFVTTSRRTPYFDGGVDSDDELTYGRQPQARRGLSIHRDNSGPEITFDEPASMNVLTSKFHHPSNHGPGLPIRAHSMIQNGYASDGRANSLNRHNRQGSLSMPGSFRLGQTNPLGGMQQTSFGTFGQLSSMPTFGGPGAGFQNHGSRMSGGMPGGMLGGVNGGMLGGLRGGVAGGMPNGMPSNTQGSNAHQPFNMFEQQLPSSNNFSGVHFGNYQDVNNAAFQVPTAFDVFGAGLPDADVPSLPAAESSFSMNELNQTNPLFFSSTRGLPEDDDQATISPPSERGGRSSRL